MRLPRSREQALLLAVVRDEAQCVVFPAEHYRRVDGFLAVHRDGLQELLHRRLFRLTRDEHLGRAKLERTCVTFGCVNPFHFDRRAGLERGSRTVCPNGHAYDEVGVTDSGHCAVCAAIRQARRHGQRPDGGALNAAKTHCPRNHPYTRENTYFQHTPAGARRKCRTCNREQHQARVALEAEVV